MLQKKTATLLCNLKEISVWAFFPHLSTLYLQLISWINCRQEEEMFKKSTPYCYMFK